jgi:hypothetical protein
LLTDGVDLDAVTPELENEGGQRSPVIDEVADGRHGSTRWHRGFYL